MSAAGEARKRHTPAPDPVEVVARALVAHFHDEPTPGHSVNPQFGCWQCESASSLTIAALRAEGIINDHH